MHPDLPRILDLQRLDLRIRELKKEVKSLPKYIAEIEQQLESHSRALEADRAELDANRKSHRALEGEVASARQKLDHLNAQMNEAKTNEQFRAFQHEIQYEQKVIGETEDHILDRMVEAETLEKNVKLAQAALGIEEEKVAREISEVRARVAADEEEMAEKASRREALAGQVSAELLRTYEQICKMRKGVGIGRADAERCLSCDVVLRPQFSNVLRSGEQVMTCESCGRILYYEPPAVDGEMPVETGRPVSG